MRKTFGKLVCITVSAGTLPLASPVVAQSTSTNAFLEENPFLGVPVVPDKSLSEISGTWSPAWFDKRTRTLTDNYHGDFSQQIDQTARIAVDNWWDQIGATLIDVNISISRGAH